MTLLLDGFHAGISEGEQADMVNESNFHPFFFARMFIAGNHERAWLSPKRAIVVFDDVSP